MAARRSGLGKGLDSLIPNKETENKTGNKEPDATKKKAVKAEPKDTLKSTAKSTASASSAKSKSTASISSAKSNSASASSAKTKSKAASSTVKSKPKSAAKSASKAPSKASAKLPEEKVPKSESYVKQDDSNISSNGENSSDIMVKISLVEPDRSQPRKEFDDDSLRELADSIKNFGIIQPLVVKKKGKFYQIIAGERRWRAAKLAGLKEVPVVVRDYGEKESVEVSIIENIQRQNLNPIEESMAYDRLIKEFDLTQEEVAHRVSKSRVAITNSLRLLKLDERVRNLLIDGKLSSGHARTLLSLENKDEQFAIANYVINKKLSVRETENYIAKLRNPKQQDLPIARDRYQEIFYKEMEEKMKEVLGSKVSINQRSKKKGKIEIEYYSQSDLEVIYNTILSIRR